MNRKLLLTFNLLVLAFLATPTYANDEKHIPLLPHPGWFSCQYSLECVAVEGACNDWLAVNKRYQGIAHRYYAYWQGKRDCTGSKGHKNADNPLCVKRRCTFAP